MKQAVWILLIRGVFGPLVRLGHAVSLLADRCVRLLTDSDLRDRPGDAGRRAACERDTVDRIVDDHVAAYQRVSA